MLIDSINQYAAAAKSAGDFDAVAKTLSAIVKTMRTTKAGFIEVLTLLGEADTRATLLVLGSDPIGAGGVSRLNNPSADGGLQFSHPVTIALIEAKRAQLPAGVADKLLNLGYTLAPLCGRVVTAEECREAVIAEESDRRVALFHRRVTTTGEILRAIDARVRAGELTTSQQITEAVLTALQTAEKHSWES